MADEYEAVVVDTAGKETLASGRYGIEYQDLIAADPLLKLLADENPPLSVTIEDRRGHRQAERVLYPPLPRVGARQQDLSELT